MIQSCLQNILRNGQTLELVLGLGDVKLSAIKCSLKKDSKALYRQVILAFCTSSEIFCDYQIR